MIDDAAWQSAADAIEVAYFAGYHKRDDEIERLRGLLQTCMDRWIPFREAKLRREINEALGNE